MALLAAVLLVVFFNKIIWGYQWQACQQLIHQHCLGQERLALARQAATTVLDLSVKAERAQEDWEALMLSMGLTLNDMADFVVAAQPRNQEVRLLAFLPSATETRASFEVIPCTINVAGPYQAVTAYIEQLEELPALIAVHNLKITSRPGGGVEASFIADLYNLNAALPVPANP